MQFDYMYFKQVSAYISNIVKKCTYRANEDQCLSFDQHHTLPYNTVHYHSHDRHCNSCWYPCLRHRYSFPAVCCPFQDKPCNNSRFSMCHFCHHVVKLSKRLQNWRRVLLVPTFPLLFQQYWAFRRLTFPVGVLNVLFYIPVYWSV